MVKVGQRWRSKKYPQNRVREVSKVCLGRCEEIYWTDEPHVHYSGGGWDRTDSITGPDSYAECIFTPPDPVPASTGERAADWLRQVADRLVEKGKSYGDSAGNPVRIFSQAGATEGIRVRIDDKLSRIARGKEWPGEDVVVDLVGYLALLAVTEDKK